MNLKNIKQQLEEEGCAVIENFFTEEETEILKAQCDKLIKNMPDDTERTIFDAKINNYATKNKNQYYFDSGFNISYFFEKDAVGPNGELKVDPRLSLNKIGHGMHISDPIFKKYTFDKRVKETVRQLGFEDPAVCQSMYIFKNPSIGSEVVAHQDASYLHTEPVKLVGLWFALDDATLENGCLWYIKGSHKKGLKRRFIRNPDKNSDETLIYDKPSPQYDMSEFTPMPVKKGDCVLIHGQVVHYSAPNKSSKQRHAYTFHVIDRKGTKWSQGNWLELKKGQSFLGVNEN